VGAGNHAPTVGCPMTPAGVTVDGPIQVAARSQLELLTGVDYADFAGGGYENYENGE